MKVIGSRSRSQEQKGRKFLFAQIKSSSGHLQFDKTWSYDVCV